MPQYKLSMIVEALDRASGPLKSAGGAVNDFGATVAKMTGAFGVTLGLTALAAGIKQFTMESIGAFSDLSESANKMAVVFKTSAGAITDFTQNSARDLGLSKQAALEATSTFGNLFTSMGLGVAPAAAMSAGLVKLAADLASFNNISPDEALMRLRSGIVGEVEPLRALGINLDAAGVKAKAMAMGLADASGAVSYASLLQARYAMILEQSSNAQGDFARTSDGLANSVRIQEAAVKNLKAAWGELTAPTYTHFVRTMTANVEALTAAIEKRPYIPTPSKEGYTSIIQNLAAEANRSLLDKAIENRIEAERALARAMNTVDQATLDMLKDMLEEARAAEAAALAAELLSDGLNATALAAGIATGKIEDYIDRLRDVRIGLAPVSTAETQAAADAKTLGDALAALRGKEAGANINAVAAAILAGKLDEAKVAANGLAWALDQIKAPAATPWFTSQGQDIYGAGIGAWVDMHEARAAGEKRLAAQVAQDARDLASANERAAQDTQAAWDKAFDAVANSAKSEFGKAQDQLRGLLPDMNLGGENKPGSNGPFERIFRAADVAKLGAASPWAAQLGLTQEEAKKIVSDFAAGFRTPEVRKLIDEAMLVDQMKSAQMAADSLTAWGNEIAAKAGVSTALAAGNKAVTAALFGNAVTGKDTAGTQTTSYAAAAKNMLGGFAGALQTQVLDKALGNELRDVARTTFGIFEGEIVDAAGKSTALKAVIFAMARAAWAAQSTTHAGQAAGVNSP